MPRLKMRNAENKKRRRAKGIGRNDLGFRIADFRFLKGLFSDLYI